MNFNDLSFFRKGYEYLLQLSGKPSGTEPAVCARFIEQGIKGLAAKLSQMEHMPGRILKLELDSLIDRHLLCALAFDLGQRGSISADDFVVLTWEPPPEPPQPKEESKVMVPERKLVVVH